MSNDFLRKRILILSVMSVIMLSIAGYWGYAEGGGFGFFNTGGSIITFTNIIRVIAIALLIVHFLVKSDRKFSAFIKKRLSVFTKGLTEMQSRILTGVILFVLFWTVLAVLDALFDPSVSYTSMYNPLPPTWHIRILRILNLFLFFAVPSFLTGLIFSVVMRKTSEDRFNALMFYLALVSFAFALSSYTPVKLEPYGPLSTMDILIYVIISLAVVVFVPRFVMTGQYMKITACLGVTAFIAAGYFYASGIEEKNIAEEAKKPHTRVLLITMDTTRGDHLSSYGYNNETTPFIDKIGSEGVIFTRAYSQMPTTDPSHTSIVTGAYPRTHGLLKNGMQVSNDSLDYLHVWFKERGFVTGAVTSRRYLVPEELGWPSFDYGNYPGMKVDLTSRRDKFVAKYAYQRAKLWIDRNYDKDFFLWVHFWDPHWPYIPAVPYRTRFNSGFKGYIHKKNARSFITEEQRYSPEKIAYTTSLYDGEISYTDEYVSKLVRYLETKVPSSSEPPLIIITSDHGDSLGELQDRLNYVFDHSETLHFGQMYIPLIIKWDGKIEGGRVLDNLVESVDIAPTLIELLKGKGTFKCDGRSFAPLLLGEPYEDNDAVFGQRRSYSTHPVPYVNVPEYSVTTRDWRLIVNELRGNELYDAVNDTEEQNNLIEEKPDVVEDLMAKLEDWKEKHKRAKPSKYKTNKEKAETLKSLGYIQ